MYVTRVCAPTVAVHLVAVYVTCLAIVVTWWKGSDASFLVQVGKVRTYECHNFGVGVVRMRQPIVFFPLPGAIWSLALATRACPLAVIDGGVCWSSASEAESSSVASPVWPSAFDDFNGDCWPSESDDESPDLPRYSSSLVSTLASGTSGSERVAWKMRLDMLAGSGCGVKA